MTARLLGIGVASPDSKLDLEQYLAMARQLSASGSRPEAMEALTRRTEITERGCRIVNGAGESLLYQYDPTGKGPGTAERLAHYTQWATELGVAASGEALERAGVSAASITHVVTASCTGFEAPGFDQGLINGLGLRPTVRRTHVGFMGCHAAINALAVAAAFAEADPGATALVCCAELCSLHYHFGDRVDQMISNALFADGAGAAVVSARGPEEAPRIAGCASALFAGTADMMRWRIADHGFEMTLAPEVPAALAEHVPGWVGAALDPHELGVRDIGGWAIHPGGPRIVRAIADALGLRPDQAEPSLAILRSRGNMSSPTILFILRELWDGGVARPWVGVAFGPGLAGELILLR